MNVNKNFVIKLIMTTSLTLTANLSYSEWVYDYKLLRHGLTLPVVSTYEIVQPSKSSIIRRVKFSKIGENVIETPTLRIRPNQEFIFNLAGLLAKKGKKLALYKKLSSMALKTNKSKVKLTKNLLNLININVFIETFLTYRHHSVFVDGNKVRKKKRMQKKLYDEIRWFLPALQINKIHKKISSGKKLSVEDYILPTFAKKAARVFTINRGPNCFHAALSFQDESIAKNGFFNVRKEKNHHRVMINFDELWRVLHKGFYPIDPYTTKLKYGDLLIFFGLPKGHRKKDLINYRWIKHATVYLFNDYTFSKGSKSANTPYTINTIKEEWTKWRNFTKNLAIRVFRKGRVQIHNLPKEDRLNWLY